MWATQFWVACGRYSGRDTLLKQSCAGISLAHRNF